MDSAERRLYHQIHPAKLATDFLAEVISARLFWQRRLAAGLVVHFVPPVVASVVLTRRTADLERLKASRAGRYVRAEMTSPLVALRVLGDVVTVIGAWRHQRRLVGVGTLLVIGGWTLGPRPGEPSDRSPRPLDQR